MLAEIVLPRQNRRRLLSRLGHVRYAGRRLPPEVNTISDRLVGYFCGQRVRLPLSWMPLDRFTPAQQDVYRAVAAISYGRVQSYGDIARQIGRPGAGRFVGNCMAKNPYPVFIPCHRVVRGDGSVGGFGGGPDLKKAMLDMEAGRGANFARSA